MLFLSMGTASVPTEVLCFLVAVRPVRGLLLRAKDLFVEATLVAPVLSRCACCAGLVALRQTFVHWRQSLGGSWAGA